MKTMKIAASMFLSLAALACPPAHAVSELQFLKDSPAARFNETDFKMMRGAIEAALASDSEATVQSWNNDKTGASGSVMSAGPGAQAGCRRLHIANSHKLLKSEGVYTYCRNPAGQWKFSRQ